MKTEKKVSCIVPVYNVAPYLDRCVRALTGQTYPNLEIILIDDGSKDDSGALCDAAAAADDRIVVIHQDNAGLSAARNAGLDRMTGDYVTCVDSDDFVDVRFVETLLLAAEETGAEIASCGTVFFEGDDHVLEEKKPASREVVRGVSQLSALLTRGWTLPTTAWGKLYAARLFRDVRYPVGKYHEDVYTTYKLLDLSGSTVILPDALYWYRQNPESITHVSFSPKHMDSLEGCRIRAEELSAKYPALRRDLRAAVAYSACKLYEKILASGADEPACARTALKAIREDLFPLLLNREAGIKTKLFAVSASVSGRLTAVLFNRIR